MGMAVSTVLPSKSSIAPAVEVVASFIEVHEQGGKLGRGQWRPVLVSMVSPGLDGLDGLDGKGGRGLVEGLEAHDGKGSKRVEQASSAGPSTTTWALSRSTSIRRRCVCRAKRIA